MATTAKKTELDPRDFLALDALLDDEERAIRDTVRDFVRKRILEPLDMTASVPDVLELAGVENVATPYVEVDGHLEEDKTWALPLSDGWRVYRLLKNCV